MNVTIPIDLFCFIIPFTVAFILSFRHSSQKTGGGFFPPSSDRDGYWFFAIPLTLIASLVIWGIYARFII